MQRVVKEIQKTHTNEVAPKLEELGTDNELHHKAFAQLKDQELIQISQKINQNKNDISQLNDENIKLYVQFDKSENMQKEIGKAVVKNRNEIEEHRKKLNFLSDQMVYVTRVSDQLKKIDKEIMEINQVLRPLEEQQ